MIKWIAAIAMLLCAGVADAQLNVPDNFEEHMPIVIDSCCDADVYIWNVSKPARKVVIDGGKRIHVWAKPGDYEVRLTIITINVSIDPSWKPEDGPPKIIKNVFYDEHYDDFKVGPGPGPDPNPDPDPDPDPEPPVSDFKQMIRDGLSKVPDSIRNAEVSVILPDGNSIKQTSSLVVADIYATIADEAEASPTSWDAATMVNESKVRVGSSLPGSNLIGWRPFWPTLSAAFKERGLKASDLPGHIDSFRDIADVLEGE